MVIDIELNSLLSDESFQCRRVWGEQNSRLPLIVAKVSKTIYIYRYNW